MRIIHSIRAALSLVLMFTLLLGGVYTYTVTGMAQALFGGKANGSLIERGDVVLGSQLIGQEFTSPHYFWGRVSALVSPYNPENSGGSNLSVNNPKLVDAVNKRVAALQKIDARNKQPIPVDLVTSSGSGLDPHISMDAALYQLPRVARARNMREEEVKEVLIKNTHSPFFGYLGDDYVNVVMLNLALDEMAHGETKKEKR